MSGCVKSGWQRNAAAGDVLVAAVFGCVAGMTSGIILKIKMLAFLTIGESSINTALSLLDPSAACDGRL
jgi:hypothetical protein